MKTYQGFFKAVLWTHFRFLQLKIGSLESEKIIEFLESENRVPRIQEIGTLHVRTGYLTFSLKKLHTQSIKTLVIRN